MPTRRSFADLTVFLASALLAFSLGQSLLAAPALTSAVSRLSHAGQVYDVTLPLRGGSGIECRDVSGGAAIVLHFSEPITSATIQIASGRASISGDPVLAGTTATVQLSDISNAQAVTLNITQVAGISGQGADATVSARYLYGDVNADGAVNAADVQAIAAQGGKPTDGGNFRCDLNLSGAINAIDAGRIRTRMGTAVRGGSTSNSTPRISSTIAASSHAPARLAGKPLTIPISLSDSETDPNSLFISATSSNPNVIPASAISITGSGTSRVVTLAAPTTASGLANVTVTVSDGLASSDLIFPIAAASTPTLLVAIMTPQSGVASSGSGASTLVLSVDETYATVTFDYSNLTSPLTGKHIHGPADPGQIGQVLFDFDSTMPAEDGSYTWTFVPVGTSTVQDIVDAIKQGRTYINIDSANYPNGEIRGQYLQVSGSTTFTPPPPPPALPGGPLTDADASRFLTQATYGPTEETINQLKAAGLDAWLEQQFNTPKTSHLGKFNDRIADGDDPNDDDMFTECWWNIALTGKDQLRQRVAYALSQIFVISQVDGNISSHPNTVASFYDLLADDAFRNYRKIIEDVSLHPAMGQYLNMRGSKASNANENYGREVLQLFSIGLYQLQPDGTLKLDATGQPIPTYDQPAVTGMAQALTGWNWHQAANSTNPGADYLNPMTPGASADHATVTKTIFDGITISAGQNAQKDLADVLNAIFMHTNTGPFICRQLIQRLVCSNPSPAYVYRVAQVFADNGQGVRGDLKAVIKAILTDYEARSTTVLGYQGFGKLREPVLRATHVLRAFHVFSNSGLYRMRRTDTELTQTPMRAPTVFNFYYPDYVYPGQIAANGLAAPELQIASETANMNADNFLNDGVRNANNNGVFKDGDLRIDVTTEMGLASNPDNLLDRLNKILMNGQMSSGMRTSIKNYLNDSAKISQTDQRLRATAAIQLVVTSPEYSVQK